MDLSIIIVNWNSADYVRDCLASIFENTTGLTFEVVVVDSGSFDTCGLMIQQEFSQVRFVQSQKNVGFACSNNLACQHATGEWLLFLNPDTEVIGSAVYNLWEQAQKLPAVGAVGCRLLNSDRSLQTSCIQSFPTILNQIFDAEVLRRLFPRSSLWGIAPLYSHLTVPQATESISGACILMKREVFEEIGQFSTDYFMYSEDVDLCYKSMRRNRVNYYVGTANIIHHGDGSVRRAKTDFATVMAVESLSRFFRKYHGGFYAWAYRQSLLLMALVRLFLLGIFHFFQTLRTEPGSQFNSFGKWWAILRWTLGRESWAAD